MSHFESHDPSIDILTYDFLVLGGGSAGYGAARTAVELGLKTAVVEGGKEIGGLCILRGCMPSKTLIASASQFQAVKNGAEFGIATGHPHIDVGHVIDRKRRLIGEFADYRTGQLQDGRFDFIRGHAQFQSNNQVRVSTESGVKHIKARTILIATGSTVSIPPIPGLKDTPFITSDDILEMKVLPRSVIVLGAGAVGLELAYYLNAMGTKVHIIQRSAQILKGVDPDVAHSLEAALTKQGIDIFTGTTLSQITKEGDQCRVEFTHQDKSHIIHANALFNALGRQPNLHTLGLEHTEVDWNQKQLAMQATQQTSVPSIFAAGDASGPEEIVHIAVAQGEMTARNAARLLNKLSGPLEEMDYHLRLFAVFTEPEVAICGLTEGEAKQEGWEIFTASYPFNDHGKSIVMGKTDGFVKLIVSKENRQILGASCVGPHASDLIHEIIAVMYFKGTANDLVRIPHYHPTLSEIWTYPAEDLMAP